MRLIIRVFFILVLLLIACETPTPSFTGACIPIKMVRGICGTAIFKIEDPAYYHLGEDVDGEVNVFLGTLECSFLRSFPNDQIPLDKILYAELNPEDFRQDCARCYALVDYSGSKNYRVRVHEKCNPTTKPDDSGSN